MCISCLEVSTLSKNMNALADTFTIADAIRAVLVSKSVPKAAHAKTLSALLGISVPHAYRKLSGAAEFTFAQVGLIETTYDVTILVIAPEVQTLATLPNRRLVITDAYLIVGDRRMSCRIRLGNAARGRPVGRYAAHLDRGIWNVFPVEDSTRFSPLFEIDQITLDTTPVE
jgi:hypothetical protein